MHAGDKALAPGGVAQATLGVEPPGAPGDPAAPVGSSANPVQVGGNMTPPPAEAKDYPTCSRTVQDSCINPADARKAKKPSRR